MGSAYKLFEDTVFHETEGVSYAVGSKMGTSTLKDCLDVMARNPNASLMEAFIAVQLNMSLDFAASYYDRTCVRKSNISGRNGSRLDKRTL